MKIQNILKEKKNSCLFFFNKDNFVAKKQKVKIYNLFQNLSMKNQYRELIF